MGDSTKARRHERKTTHTGMSVVVDDSDDLRGEVQSDPITLKWTARDWLEREDNCSYKIRLREVLNATIKADNGDCCVNFGSDTRTPVSLRLSIFLIN